VTGRQRWLFAAAGMLAFTVLLFGALVGGTPRTPPSPSPAPSAGAATPPPVPITPTPSPAPAVVTASPIQASPSGPAFDSAGSDFPSGFTMTTSWSVGEVAPGMARFLITVGGTGRYYPKFTISAYDRSSLTDSGGELEITIPNGMDTTTVAETVGRDPLRAIAVGSPVRFPARVYRLGLDRLRPWRVVVLWDPLRIAVDVGGPADGISDDGQTAVYAPAPNASVGRAFRASGAVRAFEATFTWRVRDAAGVVVASGFGKANIGTSPVWGAYDAEVALPASVSGPITLEVLQHSPKDGSEFAVVRLPLTVP